MVFVFAMITFEGSCWAFSATEAIESQWFLAGNQLPVLAPQQIVDCDQGRGDQGCDGGDTPTVIFPCAKSSLCSGLPIRDCCRRNGV